MWNYIWQDKIKKEEICTNEGYVGILRTRVSVYVSKKYILAVESVLKG